MQSALKIGTKRNDASRDPDEEFGSDQPKYSRRQASKSDCRVPRLLRYPGGKGRFLRSLQPFLPLREEIKGRYVDPFVGGASIFFYIRPQRALLSDVNPDLIDLYVTLRDHPSETWNNYCQMPDGRGGYYYVRGLDPSALDPQSRAARLLYLNRTCFKGMWRHNKRGQFNIGYGGESRRWVVNELELLEVSRLLNSADIECADFEEIINKTHTSDFLFVDPPYRPGDKEMRNAHYVGQEFESSDQSRLAFALGRASDRGVPWVMTNSAHPEILGLYEGNSAAVMSIGTGSHPGLLSRSGREVVIFNERAATRYRLSDWSVSTL
jgi:DNA adenine methylase